jgi:hypothetical protein
MSKETAVVASRIRLDASLAVTLHEAVSRHSRAGRVEPVSAARSPGLTQTRLQKRGLHPNALEKAEEPSHQGGVATIETRRRD